MQTAFRCTRAAQWLETALGLAALALGVEAQRYAPTVEVVRA